MSENNQLVLVGEVYIEADPNKGNMVILKENPDAENFFLMFVGDSEFTAIAKEKGLVEPKRPLTHDLYLSMIQQLHIEFLRVEIQDMREETYYAGVFFRWKDTEVMTDSRPSDAVALALNRKIPIYVNRSLFRRKPTPEEIKEFEGLLKTVKF